MKYILIVPDGAADEPLEELNNQTPFQVAHTPNFDWLVQHGESGLLQTIPEGMSPGSDVGNLALLGFKPDEKYTGRAPLELANLGIKLADDELVFRCNLVTIQDDVMIDYSAGHIDNDSASQIIDELNSSLNQSHIRFYAGKGYRHLMVVKDKNLKPWLNMSCVPPHDILQQNSLEHLPSGVYAETLQKLKIWAQTVLKNSPVNQKRISKGQLPVTDIWLWGQGTQPKLQSFQDRFGLKGAVISAVDLVNGIGRLAGLDIIDVPGATGYYDTDYSAKAQYALDCLDDHDFVYIHVEAPDEAGHNGDSKEKILAIERMDALIVKPILEKFQTRDDLRVLVSPDHPTPLAKRTHTSDSVPFIMYGSGISHNGGDKFDEFSAKKLNLQYLSGYDIIKKFINT